MSAKVHLHAGPTGAGTIDHVGVQHVGVQMDSVETVMAQPGAGQGRRVAPELMRVPRVP